MTRLSRNIPAPYQPRFLEPTLRRWRSFQPGFTEQHWVVLGPSAKDLNHAFDLGLATDHRIRLALPRQLGQIPAERAQCGGPDISLIALLWRAGLALLRKAGFAFGRCEVRVQFL